MSATARRDDLAGDGAEAVAAGMTHRDPAVGRDRATWSSPAARHRHVSGRGAGGAAGRSSTRRRWSRRRCRSDVRTSIAGFAGLLSLDHDTLAGVIVDCARRMAGWGVRRLVLLSAHGGNDQALQLAAARLERGSARAAGAGTAVLDGPVRCSAGLGRSRGYLGRSGGLTCRRWRRPRRCYACGRISCAWIGLFRVTSGPWTEVMPRLSASGLAPGHAERRTWEMRAARRAAAANVTWRSRSKVTGRS